MGAQGAHRAQGAKEHGGHRLVGFPFTGGTGGTGSRSHGTGGTGTSGSLSSCCPAPALTPSLPLLHPLGSRTGPPSPSPVLERRVPPPSSPWPRSPPRGRTRSAGVAVVPEKPDAPLEPAPLGSAQNKSPGRASRAVPGSPRGSSCPIPTAGRDFWGGGHEGWSRAGLALGEGNALCAPLPAGGPRHSSSLCL